MIKNQSKKIPNIEIGGNYINLDDMREFGTPSEQKTPTTLQMRITKSRLGNNTLK